ncbi:MAG: phosphotransferase enzyme family protein [Saccharofermentanales bacterium]
MFRFEGDFIYEEPYGNGHINDTYAVYFKLPFSDPHRYILQRINKTVFKHPEQIMENIERVTAHIRKKIIDNCGDFKRDVLTIIRTIDNANYFVDENEEFWRAYYFIEDATSYQTVENAEHFYKAAKAFGKFQNQLSDFNANELFESIPDFHNTVKRYDAFIEAVNNDIMKRADGVQDEIRFVVNRKKDTGILVDLLQEGKLPLKVTHNDTKLNNVMIDNKTMEGICVIDLDTVMSGLSLYDFGDSIRFGTNPAQEDEKDLSKVSMDLTLFELFTKGFLEEAGRSLTKTEIEYLPLSAKIMTLECGIRFLTDYLNGDKYFKIHRQEHNLDRCRTQFKMVSDIEDKMDAMQKIVEKYGNLKDR